MSTIIKHKESERSTNPETVVFSGSSTDLNAMTDNQGIESDTIDNGVDGDEVDLFGDFELDASFQGTISDGATMDFYIVPTADGTNFATTTEGTSGAWEVPDHLYAGSFVFIAATSGEQIRVVVQDVPLPPQDFRVFLVNDTGQTTSADTNNIMKIYFHSLQSQDL